MGRLRVQYFWGKKTSNEEVVKVLKGLLKIAKIAMPDTFYQTDKRVKAAEHLIEDLKDEL